MSERRSLRWFVLLAGVGLAIIFAVIVIGAGQPLRIAWHRYHMQQALAESQVADDPTPSYLRFQSHVEALARLRAIAKQEYRFVRVRVPTDESKHLFQRIKKRDCPPLLEMTVVYPKTPEPVVMTLWYEHEHRDPWEQFLRSVDVADYREQFMVPLSTESN
jgi:hypothetical protein